MMPEFVSSEEREKELNAEIERLRTENENLKKEIEYLELRVSNVKSDAIIAQAMRQ